MFVECFSGLMGGGKSFFSLIRIAEHIANGGVVYTNIRVQPDPWFNETYSHLMKSFWLPECFDGCRMEMHKGGLMLPVIRARGEVKEFEYNSRGLRHFLRTTKKWNLQEGQYNYLPDELIGPDLPEHLPRGSQTRPVLVIVDEALDHFESNIKGGSATAEFRSFLRHIRKLGINLVFITQDFGSLEKKVRDLTHFVWRFRDMYTWPVPIFNRPLPPPWRDHIVCEKFHRSHFGKAKAEAINKNTWVFRDPLVFGCYQSIAMHNTKIKMADDVQTDFGDSGRIQIRGKKMNKFERVGLIAALVLAVFGVFRKTEVRTEVVAAESTDDHAVKVSKSVPPDPGESVKVLYGQFRYATFNGEIRSLIVDGIEYEVGDITRDGVVIAANEKGIHIRSDNGCSTFIYPASRSSGSGEKSAQASVVAGSARHDV